MIVVCGLFAFTDKVVGNLQMATFAAFGGFATLVLASFGGTRRDKLLAHLGLAVAGSVLLTIGTMVSSSSVLAALVTVPVAFAVFFAGVTGPNAASGAAAALLGYVLPAASLGTLSMIPDRLAGWWLASIFGTAAVLVLSPRPGDDALRAAASKLAGELADELEAALDGTATDERLASVIAAKQALVASFTATPYRPTGLAAANQALANAVELLEWCTALTADAIRERADLRDASPSARRLLSATASVLADTAALLSGSEVRPDVERLERCRAEAVVGLDHLQPEPKGGFQRAAQASFHAHAIAVAVLALAAETLVASRLADPEWLETWRRRWYGGSNAAARTARRVSSVATAAHIHASVRSVWFVNSLRGAIALSVAVAVADVGSVQHGFWVVLGTLSVLRTNAASTGATALRALAGTAIGFVVGGVLLVVIGSGSGALWAALPVAVFVAAYAPGTAPFAVGQAAFTVTVAVLFNLLAPVGWKVGVVRIEDVALGCAVSVLVGLLFWPRGVAAVVGDDLADAFRSGAVYLRQAEWAAGVRGAEPDGGMAAAVAGQRLDEALRGFLAEQGSKKVGKQDLWRLVGGSLRLRLTARAVADLPGDADAVDAARKPLADRALTLATWYEQLAGLLGRPEHRPVEPLQTPSFAAHDPVRIDSGAYYGIWLCEHLNHLVEHLGELVVPAAHVAELRRQPWWR